MKARQKKLRNLLLSDSKRRVNMLYLKMLIICLESFQWMVVITWYFWYDNDVAIKFSPIFLDIVSVLVFFFFFFQIIAVTTAAAATCPEPAFGIMMKTWSLFWICKTKVVQTMFDYLDSWIVVLCNFTSYAQTLEIIKLKN